MSQAGTFGQSGGGGTVLSVSGGNNITITGTPTVNPVVNVSGTTQYAVQVGAANGALFSLALGTSGQVLTSNGPAFNPTFQTVFTGLSALTGDTGGKVFPVGGNINVIAGLSTLNCGSTVSTVGSSPTLTLNVTDVNNNTIIGLDAGAAGITASGSVGLGYTALASLTSGSSNTAIGYNSGGSLTTGTNNTALGWKSLIDGSNAVGNVAVGYQSLISVTSGSNNVAIGLSAGEAYTTESNNLCIYNLGTIADSHVIRIGTQGNGAGQQDECFIAGIVGVTVANEELVTINSMTGQLGVIAVPSGDISITGDTGGALVGDAFTFTGGTTGLTFNGAGTTETLGGTLIVGNGGTGQTTLTLDGVLYGNGTSAVGITAAGTTGQVLTATTGSAPSWQNAASSSITYTGDTGGALSPATNLNIIADVAARNCGSSVSISGSGSTLTLNVTDSGMNTIIGKNAGVAGIGIYNTVLGYQALSSLTSGGNQNTALGFQAMALFTGPNTYTNTAVGLQALNTLLTGDNNVALGNPGISSGFGGYTSSESNNIIIGNAGVTGDSGVIRIGLPAGLFSQTSCYIAGIDGIALTTANVVTEVSSQLGSAVLTAGTNMTIDSTSTPNQIIFNASGGGSGISTITGNDGTPESPSAGNFNIVTSNGTPTFVGSSATETLNWNIVSPGIVFGSLNTGYPDSSSGSYNVGIGYGLYAGINVTNPSTYCVALGYNALSSGISQFASTIGIGLGAFAAGGAGDATDQNSIAIGVNAIGGSSNQDQDTLYSIGIGYNSMSGGANDNSSVAIGINTMNGGSGSNNTSNNVAIGSNCMAMAGGQANSGSSSIAIGYGNLIGNGSGGGGGGYQGSQQIAIGSNVLTAYQNGSYNIGIGYNVLSNGNFVTGNANIAIGYTAGSGYDNSGGFGSGESNNILIGNPGTSGDQNVMRLGKTGSGGGQVSTCYIAGIQGITVTGSAVLVSASDQLGIAVSSQRYKENIKSLESTRVLELQPKSFTYNVGQDRSAQTGLIAEQVYEIMPELVVLDKEGLPQTVKYQDLPVLLLLEIQKLRKELDDLKTRK